MAMINILVSNQKETSAVRVKSGPIVLGRAPKTHGQTHTIQDDYCSAHQLQVEELPGSRVRLTNMSTKVSVALSSGNALEPGATCETALPLRLGAGKTVIEIEPARSDQEVSDTFATIAQPIALRVRPPLSPEQSGLAVEKTAALSAHEWGLASLSDLSDVPGVDRLTRWFETLVTVQRSAASSDAFFQETARAVVDLIGLDCGLILSFGEDDWKPEACFPANALPAIGISQMVLEKVRRERRTYFRNIKADEASTTLSGVSTLVASPIFGGDGAAVVGAVYGVRFLQATGVPVEIRPLEAQLVQVLAAAVGAGLARRESELEAVRRYVQFEQFFSHALARELDRDPSLLEGHERELTILVSDIRGFSRISEHLGPRETCLLMNDVLERLTFQIHEQGGVVVDYVGDGIMAMWNAPVAQPDHSARACRAALAMQAELPGLNEQWQKRIKSPLGLGIGINTGAALVGNTGCPRKFKYGPLGHTVNLASRVEGATKQLCVPTLITGSTHDQLAGSFATRRLCRAHVVGIDATVDLHELHSAEIEPDWQFRRDLYETALSLYESRQWTDACRTLYPMLAEQEGRYDLPTLSLIGRTIECLKSNPAAFDPVLRLTDK
jgi:adenylate cyclase